MFSRIRERLRELEEERDIDILFAVEAGSRVWGMSNEQSDYDVKYVYRRKPKHYININSGDKGHTIRSVHGDIELDGWDLKKFLKLLYNSNPSTIEWLRSDIKYYASSDTFKTLNWETNFNPTALYYHYVSLAKSNYKKYICVDKNKNINLKKYLYVIRGLLSARWIVETDGELPPLKFKDMIEANWIPVEIKNIIRELLEYRITNSVNVGRRISELDRWIEMYLYGPGPENLGKDNKFVLEDFNEYLMEQVMDVCHWCREWNCSGQCENDE